MQNFLDLLDNPMRIEHFWLYCNDRHIFLLIKMFQSTPQINKKTSNKSWIPLIYRCRLSVSVLTQCDTTRQEDEKSTEGQTIQICWELFFIFSSPTPTHQPACLLILKEALGLLNVIFFIDFEWLASIHLYSELARSLSLIENYSGLQLSSVQFLTFISWNIPWWDHFRCPT